MASAAVSDATKFRQLLCGKQAGETAHGLWDPVMLQRLRTRVGAKPGDSRWH